MRPREETTFFHLVETPLPRAARLAVLLYVVIYRVLAPPLAAAFSDQPVAFLLPRALLEGALEMVLILPILFVRRIGFFHPLALPSFLVIAMAIGFAPAHLIAPGIVASKPFLGETASWAYVLNRITAFDYGLYRLHFAGVSILFWLSLYAGYALAAAHKSTPSARPAHASAALVPVSAMAVILFAGAAAVTLLQSSGGIAAHILAMTRGRYLTLQDAGAAIVAAQSAVIALWAWAATARRDPLRSPLFLASTAAVLPLVWLAGGSRGSVIYALMGIVIIAAFRARRLPARLIIAGALVAVALIGMLGAIRRDFGAVTVNVEALAPANFGAWLEGAADEMRARTAEEGDLAAFVAARTMGRLDGESYLSVLAFPVPRPLWPDKPRTAHAITTWVAFMGHPLGEPPGAWGIPLGPVAEAYWNFGLFGCVVVGGAVGAILGGLVAAFRARPRSPGMAVAYVIFLLYFTGGSREAQYVMQYGAALLVVLAGARLLHALLARRPALEQPLAEGGLSDPLPLRRGA